VASKLPNIVTAVLLLIIATGLLNYSAYAADSKRVPRTVVGVYDSSLEVAPDRSLLHRFVEMPLNWLGLKVEFREINDPTILRLANDPEIRGIITCFPEGSSVARPEQLLGLLGEFVKNGKTVAILGEPGFFFSRRGVPTPLNQINQLLRHFGVEANGQYLLSATDLKPQLVEARYATEQKFVEPSMNQLPMLVQSDPTARVLVTSKILNEPTAPTVPLVVLGKSGLVALTRNAFNLYSGQSPTQEVRGWFIDPIELLRSVFGTDAKPIPDLTTSMGRRMAVTLIEGGDWSKESHIEQYFAKRVPASEVIRREIVEPQKGFIFSIAPVAAELDPQWGATQSALNEAREIFKLSNVEANVTGYSDVWDWAFFESNHSASREAELLSLYPSPTWKKSEQARRDDGRARWKPEEPLDFHGWLRPRRFAVQRFDLDREILGALKLVKSLTSDERPSGCLVWSGSRYPAARALVRATQNEVCSLGGGRSVVDGMHPSLAWLEPISSSIVVNDDTHEINRVPLYPLAGEDAYLTSNEPLEFGFRGLTETLTKTETPRRLRPIAIRFGISAGLSDVRLQSVKFVLDFASKSEPIPISLSSYIRRVNGFYSIRMEECGPSCWTLLDRQGIDTVRFDGVGDSVIDWSQSQGVLGARVVNGSLYISLDPSVVKPVVAIAPKRSGNEPAQLIGSNWEIKKLRRTGSEFDFTTVGVGAGTMQWSVPWSGATTVEIFGLREPQVSVIKPDSSGALELKVPESSRELHVRVYHGTPT